MRTAAALAPIVGVLVLMLRWRWSAARAGVVVAVGTLVLATLLFGLGASNDDPGLLSSSLGVFAEAFFVAAMIAVIIGPALAVHELQQQTGATDRLQSVLGRLSPDPRVAALTIAWFFSLFLEGAAGFGTAVALAAPFLVASGFRPVTAVVASMVGHAAGVSFGAIGTPVAAQAVISGINGSDLAGPTALFHVALGWFLAAMVVYQVGDQYVEHGRPWRMGMLAAVTFFVPYGLIARFVGPELPTLGGAIVGGAAFLGLLRFQQRHFEWESLVTAPTEALPIARDVEMPAARAAAPYLIVVVLVLVTRLVAPIKDALSSVVIDWQLPGGFSGSVLPLYHPGLLLALAFVLGALVQRARPTEAVVAAKVAARQLIGVSVALVAMVTIARTMSAADMTSTLAESASRTGGFWPLLAPVVGALGTFVTGSATASNILFTDLQMDTAKANDLSEVTMLASQGFGAAVGNMLAPHNIVAAAATVGLVGQENEILKKTLPIALFYLALGGALTVILV